MEPKIPEPIYEAYLNALLAGDRLACVDIVKKLVSSGIGLTELYVHLFQRALYRIGELWEHQRVSVAVEHLATAITEYLIAVVQPQIFGSPHQNRSIIIACVADEYHQLGGRMVADLFELRGWHGYFLGANTPVQDLLHMVSERKPDIIGVSLSIYFNLPSLLTALDAIRGDFPSLPVIVGGQAFRWGGQNIIKRYPNVTYLASAEDLERFTASDGLH